MIAGIAATKADLTEWVYEQGLTALHLLLREDAEVAGPKGKHEKERTHEQGLTSHPSAPTRFHTSREDAEKIAGPKGKHEKERTHNHWGTSKD